jgi:hypothetical protein
MDASELQRIREDITRDLLFDTCDIITVTKTPDGFGGVIETLGTASASIACRMDHKSGVSVLAGGELATFQGNMLTLPYDTTITTTNRVLYGGAYYSVISVSEGSWLGVKRAEVEKI